MGQEEKTIPSDLNQMEIRRKKYFWLTQKRIFNAPESKVSSMSESTNKFRVRFVIFYADDTDVD